MKNVAKEGQEKKYERKEYEFDPLSVGIPRCVISDLKGGTPKENALEFIDVLKGGTHQNAKRDSIILNAGVGCYVYGVEGVTSIAEGVALARSVLESGKASAVFENWKMVSNKV